MLIFLSKFTRLRWAAIPLPSVYVMPIVNSSALKNSHRLSNFMRIKRLPSAGRDQSRVL